jgi:hypothetical protein
MAGTMSGRRQALTMLAAVAVPAVLGMPRAFAGDGLRPGGFPAWPLVQPTLVVSPNWSGYVVGAAAGAAVSFSRVTGSWRLPAARCGPADAGALAAIWVGIGGYASSGKLEQIGTEAGCDRLAGRRYAGSVGRRRIRVRLSG